MKTERVESGVISGPHIPDEDLERVESGVISGPYIPDEDRACREWGDLYIYINMKVHR